MTYSTEAERIANKKASNSKYKKTPKGKACNVRYLKTPKGKAYLVRQEERRKLPENIKKRSEYAAKPERRKKIKKNMEKPVKQINSIWQNMKSLSSPKNRNRPFTITEKWVMNLWITTVRCPCGVLLSLIPGTDSDIKGEINPNKFTLDEIIPHLGCVEGNIQALCWKCNEIKSNYYGEDFFNFCVAVATKKIKVGVVVE